MKLFIKRFLLVSFVSVLIIPPFIYLLHILFPSPFLPNINYKKNGSGLLGAKLAEADTTRDIDVLVIGSSHAYRSINTQIFKSISILNLGSSGQTPIQSNYLLNKYLAELKPKVILWEVFPGLLNSDGLESSIDFISNIEPRVSEIENQLFLDSNGKEIITLTYIINVFEFFFNPVNAKTENEKEMYLPGGFIMKKNYQNAHGLKDRKTYFDFPPNQNDKLEKGISFIHNTLPETKIFLFQAPITNYYFEAINNMPEFDSFFESLTLAENNLLYKNFNLTKQNNYNDSIDFYDAVHMTYIGANKFSEALQKDLSVLINER
ncbi:hypothetical protein QYS48_33840 [Marivirga arenosa]|uniref:DUF1574 domain-containing protein n=1 Tax=Marivirga arenosa TaxID=3059076 RepID=A0AA51R6N1_9BACT|nr:hypothetical protein [Marivirga sp. ABR2-2]WMN06817.1 hypothetical protein QYS48_33840 [Marivirga sp. ABR2-2]